MTSRAPPISPATTLPWYDPSGVFGVALGVFGVALGVFGVALGVPRGTGLVLAVWFSAGPVEVVGVRLVDGVGRVGGWVGPSAAEGVWAELPGGLVVPVESLGGVAFDGFSVVDSLPSVEPWDRGGVEPGGADIVDAGEALPASSETDLQPALPRGVGRSSVDLAVWF